MVRSCWKPDQSEDGVRGVRVWARLLGVERAVVEDIEFEEATGSVVVSVRLRKGDRGRCGICQQRSPGYDAGDGRRRWRALDLGTTKAYLEAAAPRVRCRTHGVVVAAVPWARHGAGHSRAFDDTVAWLAVHTSRSAVTELLRLAWRTVGAIVARVVADAEAGRDRLADLRRIGIDEISHRRDRCPAAEDPRMGHKSPITRLAITTVIADMAETPRPMTGSSRRATYQPAMTHQRRAGA